MAISSQASRSPVAPVSVVPPVSFNVVTLEEGVNDVPTVDNINDFLSIMNFSTGKVLTNKLVEVTTHNFAKTPPGYPPLGIHSIGGDLFILLKQLSSGLELVITRDEIDRIEDQGDRIFIIFNTEALGAELFTGDTCNLIGKIIEK